MAQEQDSYLFTDWPVHVVAIDYTGQFVALPGRGGVALIDLAQPKQAARKITRQSKWDCNAVEWNPHDAFRHRLASTSNTKVELWTWREGNGTKEEYLRAHTRAISDLNWSKFDPNLLATCSYDSFIYIWDLSEISRPKIATWTPPSWNYMTSLACFRTFRDSRKPKALSTVSGASQVKWNSGTRHILATSHDGDVRIWDLRKGNSPVSYISAHLSKISGLDWCPSDERQLLTCSLDKTVKLWDVFADTRNAMAICDHRAPVWRAKYTPHGNSILTVPLSTASQRIINVPYLWNITNLKNPVQTLYGATSVLEFQWRCPRDDSEFQLLSWSRDQMLKLWNLDPRFCQGKAKWQYLSYIGRLGQSSGNTNTNKPYFTASSKPPAPQEIREEQKSRGSLYDPILSPEPPDNFSSSGEDDATDVNVTSDHESLKLAGVGQPHNLEEEINNVRNIYQNLVIEEVDITNRSCVVSVNSGNNNSRMIITFPSLYPDEAMPSFEFTEDSPIDSATKVKIIKTLREKAESCLANSDGCLESCLNSLVSGLEDLKVQASGMTQLPFMMYSVGLESQFGLHDAAIPFPRTSGATFCASGVLVCFSRSARYLTRKREFTPRSLSALSAYSLRSLSSFYNLEMLKTGVNKSGNNARKALVILRDSSPLMAFHRSLAQNYCIFGRNAKDICEKNKKAAMMVGRQDLIQSWSLLALIMDPKLTPSPSSSDPPWASHPFGRKLIDSLLDYYMKIGDIQMLAMIACLLSYQSLPESFSDCLSDQEDNQKSYVELRGTRNFNLLEEESPSFEETLSVDQSPYQSINGYSPSFMVINLKNPVEEERKKHEKNCRFINKEKQSLFDHYKKCYARLLYKWQLMNQRSEVLKLVAHPERFQYENDLLSDFFSDQFFSGTSCNSCKNPGFRCVICRFAIKGSSTFCLSCGHGGHALHILKWFETKDVCATGCGCHCAMNGYFTEP